MKDEKNQIEKIYLNCPDQTIVLTIREENEVTREIKSYQPRLISQQDFYTLIREVEELKYVLSTHLLTIRKGSYVFIEQVKKVSDQEIMDFFYNYQIYITYGERPFIVPRAASIRNCSPILPKESIFDEVNTLNNINYNE